MLSIIFQDNHLLCLDKPGGMLTQPSGTDRESLEGLAKDWIKQEFNKPGQVFLEAVHRIDAPACGIVLFARTSKALSRMTQAIREGRCRKEYRVLVEGCPKASFGELRDWLRHDEHYAHIARKGDPEAREARLSYEVLEKRPDGVSLLRVLLDSGRYHQIRAQFAHAGCPVLGDARYGAKRAYRRGCIALQHFCLEIEHPVTHETLTFRSNITL